jgi:hypothetical protein
VVCLCIEIILMKSFIFVVLTVCTTNNICLSVPKAKEEQVVKAIVQNFWSASRKIDWRGMEARISFPFTAIPVGPNFMGARIIYPNPSAFEANFQGIRQRQKRGLRLEVSEKQKFSRISNLKAQLNTSRLAIVTYTYHPAGDKVAYELQTFLRKGKTGWKMSSSTIPR